MLKEHIKQKSASVDRDRDNVLFYSNVDRNCTLFQEKNQTKNIKPISLGQDIANNVLCNSCDDGWNKNQINEYPFFYQLVSSCK